jgi:hypothetical protein
LVDADDSVAGVGDHGEVARATRGVQHDAADRTGLQQTPHPFPLDVVGVGVLVIGGRLRVVRREYGGPALIYPGLSIHADSLVRKVRIPFWGIGLTYSPWCHRRL